VLALAAERLRAVKPGDADADRWWFFACGAGCAGETAGVLTEEQCRRWDEVMQAQAERLEVRPDGELTAPSARA
jgi:hypothetical protein